MHHRDVFSILAGSMVVIGCATHQTAQTAPSKAPEPTAVTRSEARPADPLAALPPPAAAGSDAETHAKYSNAVGDGPRSAIDPSSKPIPAPPATIDVHPDSGVDAAIKLVPSKIPQGRLSKEILTSPLKDPARFERCAIPPTTRVAIRVAVYNGQAIGVDVRSNPNTPALDFCVDRIVRQTTWVKELAVNQVNVTL
jgi:hypothetical protein